MESPQNQQEMIRSQRGGRGKKKVVKITYISSPMKVKASNASEFRAIVQELTGCNSNRERWLDAWSNTTSVAAKDDEDGAHSISVISPICPTSRLDQAGFIWREASEDLLGFQFLLGSSS